MQQSRNKLRVGPWRGIVLLSALLCLAACRGEKEVPAAPVVPLPAPAMVTPDSWNTYHGDAALTGGVAGGMPDALDLLWRYRGGSDITQTPVIADGRIFAANDAGQVFALDGAGALLWSTTLMRREDKGPESLDAPLACFEGRIYAAAAYGRFFALDAVSGEILWTAETNASFLGTPVFSAGKVLAIDQDDGAVFAFDAATGATLWKSEGVSRCDGSPSVNAQGIVFGSCAEALHVLDPKTGKLLRELDVPGDDPQVAGGVALVGSSVFSGSRSGIILHANFVTGKSIWNQSISDGEIFATPAVYEDWVVTAAEDGTIHGLDRKTGAIRWSYETPDTPLSPVIVGKHVLAVSGGTLYLLGLDDGKELWSFAAGDHISSPAVAMGLVVVAGEDGVVTAFGAN
jgi:eukaryotic-like serine/threonine-protein kinase